MGPYLLEIDERQARILNEALDLYVRIHLGQLEAIPDHVPRMRGDTEEVNQHSMRKFLGVLKELVLGQPENGSFGIHNELVNDVARVAFETRCVIRHQLWKDSASSTYGVDSSPPYKISTGNSPLPKIVPK